MMSPSSASSYPEGIMNVHDATYLTPSPPKESRFQLTFVWSEELTHASYGVPQVGFSPPLEL